MSAESYETFDIRDRDTHEYIRNLTREQLAQYVLGELEPYKSSKTNSKFEPLRDEIHHIIRYAGFHRLTHNALRFRSCINIRIVILLLITTIAHTCEYRLIA